MVMREADVERTLTRALLKRGALVRKLQWVSRRGAPDRFVVIHGRIVLVELKSPTGRLSKGQVYEHEMLRAAGVDTRVIRSIDEVLAFMHEVDTWKP